MISSPILDKVFYEELSIESTVLVMPCHFFSVILETNE